MNTDVREIVKERYGERAVAHSDRGCACSSDQGVNEYAASIKVRARKPF